LLVNPSDQIIELLKLQQDVGYIGEPLSQLAHALQCADFAAQDDADECVILAALLHDIGHFCDPRASAMLADGVDFGVHRHETVGAEYLRLSGLDETIATLVEQHVNAKRYLVATRPAYAAKLSAASQQTLTFQGGPMRADEVLTFEQQARFVDILKLRAWDEAAKRLDVSLPPVSHYSAMLRRNKTQRLSTAELAFFASNGYLHIKDWFNATEVAAMCAEVAQLQALPDSPGKWMKYYEHTARGKQLCRIENFLPYQRRLERLARGRSTLGLMGELMGEPAVLFKEKLNLKLAAGNGFSAHQDAPAFTSFDQHYHITMMLSVDETTTANGCLEVASGAHQQGLLAMNPDLTMTQTAIDQLSWQSVETQPGDLLLFDSYLPHRSAMNETDHARRALDITYNRQVEGGDVRDAYFAAKRAAFPPEIERQPGTVYAGGVFNVGNPVDK
jgi:2-aminoethylphosphonate dioxygenase